MLIASLVLGSPAFAAGDVTPLSPLGPVISEGKNDGLVRGEISMAETPLFSGAPMDRMSLFFAARHSPASGVNLRAAVGARRATWADGEVAGGIEDVRLATEVRFLEGQVGGEEGAMGSLWFTWEGKMPNARDTSGLGTDETDISVGLFGRLDGERVSLLASGELLILGDPLQFANQDDAFRAAAGVETTLGPLEVKGRVVSRFESPRNPLWLASGATVGHRRERWGLSADLLVGLSDAAPLFAFGANLQLFGACPAEDGD